MEINEVPHQPCLTELSEYQGNEPVTQITVLKAKKKKKIQEAQIWTDFTEEAASFQDGQVSLTIANNNNNKHLPVLIHLPMRTGTIFSPILKKRIFSPILKKRIPRHREAKQHAQDHTAGKGQSLDESPGRLLPEATLLTSSLCHLSQHFLPLTATQGSGRRPGESLKVSSFLFKKIFIYLFGCIGS